MSKVEGETRRGRSLTLKEAERVRASVERGVKEVLEPFIERVREQSKIPNSKTRIRSAA